MKPSHELHNMAYMISQSPKTTNFREVKVNIRK